MSLDLTYDKSTLVQVMAWCRQATSHYLSQCWPRSLTPYGVTRPQWVKWWHYDMLSTLLAQLDCLFNSLFRLTSSKYENQYYWPFVSGIHWWLVVSSHKGPVAQKEVPFHDVIMSFESCNSGVQCCSRSLKATTVHWWRNHSSVMNIPSKLKLWVIISKHLLAIQNSVCLSDCLSL